MGSGAKEHFLVQEKNLINTLRYNNILSGSGYWTKRGILTVYKKTNLM